MAQDTDPRPGEGDSAIDSLLALGQRLVVERDPITLLQHLCIAARDVTRAQITGAGILSDNRQRVEHLVGVGGDVGLTAELRTTLARNTCVREVVQTRRAMRMLNPSGDPCAFALPPSHPPVHSGLLAPIASPTRVHGWLALVEKIGAAEFSDADERLATVLGAQVGTAYENARLMAELVATTEELRDQEDQMEFAMSVARVGVSFRTLDATDITLSRSLADLLGLEPGMRTISRQDFLTRVHPDDVERVGAAVAEAVAKGSSFELEYRFHTPHRGWRWLRSNGRVTPHRPGHPVRLFSGITDVTERRSLESQLQHAQKMEAIGQLAGGVAHDFNNLLTAIGGYARLLAESLEEGDQRHDVEEIISAAERAASLTRQLLAFSRRQVLESRPLDLNGLVEDMASMLRRILGEGIELVTMLAPRLPPVRADRGQLEQVIMNLVVNARDAISGAGTIRIDTATVDGAATQRAALKAGTYAVLAIADTGSGMSDEVRARLFEPFFTTKPRGQGTGLGLATAYGIVAQSGGTIAVSTEPGRGSTFYVYLPCDELSTPFPDRAVEQTTGSGGSETVLLAEDEPAVRTLARRILQRAGYTVIDAANAAEAEGRARTMERIDILVTDVMMPGGTGPDLYRRLSVVRPEMKVLFMSGYAERDLFDRAAIDWSAPFLEKPFTTAALVAKVRDVLDA